MANMTFNAFRDMVKAKFDEMASSETHLYVVDANKDELWETYLKSFPTGTNPIFRVRQMYDCSCCRHFIKNVGNVVSLRDGKVTSIWDIDCEDATFGPVAKAMSEYIHAHTISDVFLTVNKREGCKVNYEQSDDNAVLEFNHFYCDIPSTFYMRNKTDKNSALNDYRSGKDVLLRTLQEISTDAVNTLLDLCDQNALYKGPEYVKLLKEFKQIKDAYNKLELGNDEEQTRLYFAWEKSIEAGPVVSRIKNTAIGTLLVDISNGVDIEEAVKKYETITAPSNYKRSKPIFTKKMLEDARKTIEDLGYSESLPRRFATLQDITVNDILFVNRNDAKKMKDGDSIFDQLSKMASSPKEAKPQKFDGVEEIGADAFVSDILPSAEEVQVYLENKHSGNFMSLIAPKNEGSKSMFKWGNNFSWAYSGNMTDSMKQRVKEFGGRVDGDLRFSIQWNEDGHDNCDLDAHCVERFGMYGAYEIYFGSARAPRFSPTKGQLDVDIISPGGNIAVENITWANRKTMKPGIYKFFVHVYAGRAAKGFRAEIEFDGNIYSFNCDRPISFNQKIPVADVEYCRDGTFKIRPILPLGSSSKDIWNLKTNEFVPVSTICYSPNHWSTAENQTGHKHLFFMLKNCKSDETPSGMFNEYLVDELYSHRRVMEALSNEMRVTSSDDQLSGLGFAFDKRADIVVKVSGTETRVFRVKF